MFSVLMSCKSWPRRQKRGSTVYIPSSNRRTSTPNLRTSSWLVRRSDVSWHKVITKWAEKTEEGEEGINPVIGWESFLYEPTGVVPLRTNGCRRTADSSWLATRTDVVGREILTMQMEERGAEIYPISDVQRQFARGRRKERYRFSSSFVPLSWSYLYKR